MVSYKRCLFFVVSQTRRYGSQFFSGGAFITSHQIITQKSNHVYKQRGSNGFVELEVRRLSFGHAARLVNNLSIHSSLGVIRHVKKCWEPKLMVWGKW